MMEPDGTAAASVHSIHMNDWLEAVPAGSLSPPKCYEVQMLCPTKPAYHSPLHESSINTRAV